MQNVIAGGWNWHREWLSSAGLGVFQSRNVESVPRLNQQNWWWLQVFLPVMCKSKPPSKAHVFSSLFPPAEKSTAAQGHRIKHSQCENSRLVCSSHLPAGQFKHHLCNQRIWKGHVKKASESNCYCFLPTEREDQNVFHENRCLEITFLLLIATSYSQGYKTLQDLFCLAHVQ